MSESRDITYFQSPVGWLKIEAKGDCIQKITFQEKEDPMDSSRLTGSLKNCLDQLDGYFNGTLKEFHLKLNPEGSEFQVRVWNELEKIKYGQTITYQALAFRLGNKKTIRAAGSANGKNPLAIVIPCHRVIGTGGKLTGYAGGLERKKWLLEHEQKVLFGVKDLFDLDCRNTSKGFTPF